MITTIALLAGMAQAQEQDASVNFELFRPHGDLYGFTVTQGAATLGNLQLGIGVWGNYSDDPVTLANAAGERVSMSGTDDEAGDGLVDSRFVSDFQVGMGFTKYVSLTVDIPLVLSQSAYDLGSLDNAATTPVKVAVGGISDIVVQPKFAILDGDALPIGLSVAVPVGLPTGGSDAPFLGEGGVTVAPKLILEYADGKIRSREYMWRVAANAGYLLRGAGRVRDTNVGNEFQYAAAFGIHPAKILEVDLEFHGATMGAKQSQNPAEVLLSTQLLLGRFVAIHVGGGTGVLGGIGSPDYRVFGGIAFAPTFDKNARDTDSDGISDGDDKCPKDPEDKDGYQDEDGCPELDNDADGREDSVDKCPDDPEDDDGYMDNDGCPDPDNDKDGVVDAADRCPDEAETVNGHLDEDGCPDDKPVDDTDGDGFKDDVDRCPYDPEDMNGFEDEDGCPDDRLKNARVVVTQSSIEIREVIFFDFGKATIQERSFDLLNEIATVMTAHPELKKIRVEGHTDAVGNDTANLKLSQARAESVAAFLVSKGVDKARLEARGFGEMNPIDSNDTEDGRSKNRRVEFIIISRE